MGPELVVGGLPGFDETLRFPKGEEDLAVEQLVTQPAVDTLDLATLPGAAGFDEERLRPDPFKPPSAALAIAEVSLWGDRGEIRAPTIASSERRPSGTRPIAGGSAATISRPGSAGISVGPADPPPRSRARAFSVN